VKVAILETLRLLINHGGLLMKPFVAPLQTTFLKALVENSKGVRVAAASALASLMPQATKIELVITGKTISIYLSIFVVVDFFFFCSLYIFRYF
jgi:hypothetical protein